MAIKKAKYYRFNGVEWDQYLFETSADVIVETQNYKVMTADERQKISTYLNSFNSANKLLQLNNQGKIDVEFIPDLDQYAKLNDNVDFYSVSADYSVHSSSIYASVAAFIN